MTTNQPNPDPIVQCPRCQTFGNHLWEDFGFCNACQYRWKPEHLNEKKDSIDIVVRRLQCIRDELMHIKNANPDILPNDNPANISMHEAWNWIGFAISGLRDRDEENE